jgi:hypothetical protein
MRQATDLDFLLHPLANEYIPKCSACGATMELAILATSVEGPDVSMFVCSACQCSGGLAVEDDPPLTVT